MSLVGEAVQAGHDAIFAASLPSNLSRWSQYLLEAGRQYNVSPWLLAGIMQRESNGGLALTPKDETGTGDFTPRGSTSKYRKYANPATGLPPDGRGWGRGLMQIDYGVHNAWVIANPWHDAQTNINKSAEIVAAFAKQLSAAGLSGDALTEGVLAAYNAGASNVMKALAAGLPPSAYTTGGDYAPWVMARVGPWIQKFNQLVG